MGRLCVTGSPMRWFVQDWKARGRPQYVDKHYTPTAKAKVAVADFDGGEGRCAIRSGR